MLNILTMIFPEGFQKVSLFMFADAKMEDRRNLLHLDH